MNTDLLANSGPDLDLGLPYYLLVLRSRISERDPEDP
jgi:hypothetical protein